MAAAATTSSFRDSIVDNKNWLLLWPQTVCYCNEILVVFISLDFLCDTVDNFSFLCIYSDFESVTVGIEVGNKNLSSGVFLN